MWHKEIIFKLIQSFCDILSGNKLLGRKTFSELLKIIEHKYYFELLENNIITT